MDFQHNFYKNICHLKCYYLAKFHCHTIIASLDIKQYIFLVCFLGQLMTSLILSFIMYHFINERAGKKRIESLKVKYLKNAMSFYVEIKSIFHQFLRAFI